MTISHTTIHHGADILELTVKTLRQGEEIICSKRTFGAIKDRLNENIRSQRPRKFASRDWGGMQHIKRLT